MAYDAAGNQTGNGTDSWVYDPRGLIKQYRQNGSTVAAYTYDYRSLRSKKALTGAQTTVYLYDLQGQLIAEYENGSLKREYVWLDGASLAQIDAETGGESITWFTTDHLFTPRLGTDSSKEPVWQWDSYAFGDTEPFLPTGSSGTMPTVNLRFPGQYFDDESDRHYNWYRYYNSGSGRYISSDPIGLSGGTNTYAYTISNPLLFIDPLGLEIVGQWVQKPFPVIDDFSVAFGKGNARRPNDWWKIWENLGTYKALEHRVSVHAGFNWEVRCIDTEMCGEDSWNVDGGWYEWVDVWVPVSTPAIPHPGGVCMRLSPEMHIVY